MITTNAPLPLIDVRSRTDRVRECIIDLIRSRGLAPGAPFSTERELAKQLGVGRSTIREAVGSLAILGVIEVRPGRGLFVGPHQAADAPPPDALDALQLPTRVSWQLVELRSILESAAGGLAARRRTAEDIRRLQAAIEELRTAFVANDLEAVILADVAFHLALARASHNDSLVQALNAIAPSFIQQRRELYRAQQVGGAFTSNSVVSTHEALLKPIMDGDVKGIQDALEEHFVLSWEYVTLWPLDEDGA